MKKNKHKDSKDIKLKTTSIERKLKSNISPNIKKFVLYFLLNSYIGKFLKFFRIKKNLFGGRFDYSLVSNIEASKIFWGIWESAEIRFAKRFADSKIIIELGSSVGVTLGVLSNVRKNTKFICIEASSKNFKKLNILKSILPKHNEYIFVNKAIAYGVDKVSFEFMSTTGSKININNKMGDFVNAVTLSDLLKENEVNEEYTLITDIEGAEEAVFFEDPEALKSCVTVIAELENTPKRTVDDQIKRLEELGFKLIERYGCVVVMRRK